MSSNSRTATPPSFFTFGPNDAYISKSHQGLKFANLTPTLTTLLTAAQTIHWATLGPHPGSWLISYTSLSGHDTLRWGDETPARLRSILAKTWHSPHLRAFLGPDDSFIIWHPELIRWGGLPEALEDKLQSWLTPSGWRVGAPRLVSWGPGGAGWIAVSEYGDVGLEAGDEWEIWGETIDEWRSEKGFRWADVEFVSLDASAVDQFVAVRKDGTWAGSIDGEGVGGEEALESFARNFFSRARAHKSKPSTSTATSQTTTSPPDPTILYTTWETTTATLLTTAQEALNTTLPPPRTPLSPPPQTPTTPPSTPPPGLLTAFPYLPSAATTCTQPACIRLKADTTGLRACKHDVEVLLRGSGKYGLAWLRQERLRWHPDRFGRLCAGGWREEGRKVAEEMFKVVDGLVEEEGRRKGGV